MATRKPIGVLMIDPITGTAMRATTRTLFNELLAAGWRALLLK